MADRNPLLAAFRGLPIGTTRKWEPLQKPRLAAEMAAIVAHAVLLAVSAHKIRSHPDILLLFIMSAITLGFHLFYVAGVWHWKNVKPLFNNTFTYGGNSRNTLKWLEYATSRAFPNPYSL
tara:strand:- start:493 stop:852 length:360 start_codon:yes stop_codon:yes gene_type:complete